MIGARVLPSSTQEIGQDIFDNRLWQDRMSAIGSGQPPGIAIAWARIDESVAPRGRRALRQRQRETADRLARERLAARADHAEAKWRLVRDAVGRPVAVGRNDRPGPAMSIAHSGALVALAISDIGPVGIDVEDRRRVRDFRAIATSYFSADDATLVERGGAPVFYRLWTAYEATLKLDPVGERGFERRHWEVGGYTLCLAWLATRSEIVSEGIKDRPSET